MDTTGRLGHYSTKDGHTWTDKLEALRYGTQNRMWVNFNFHDEVWTKFDRSRLGKVPLMELYKLRARQLRDNYDYLVLHYSGGSDSHNILHTFLSNNIKLDEVVVKWSKVPKDKGMYTANNKDKSPRNALSEWDYTIKPTLDWLAKNKPEIKINVVDFTLNVTSESSTVEHVQERISNIQFSRGAFGSFVLRTARSTEQSVMANAPRHGKVAHIFGVEKPLLLAKDKGIYCYFTDAGMETSTLERDDLRAHTELFYWSHELPELPLEQAYQAALFVKFSSKANGLLFTEDQNIEDINRVINSQSALFKSVLYPHSWSPSKFQADKPNVLRSDWWWWTHESEELKPLLLSFNQAMNNLTTGIGSVFLLKTPEVNLLKPITTKPIFLMDL